VLNTGEVSFTCTKNGNNYAGYHFAGTRLTRRLKGFTTSNSPRAMQAINQGMKKAGISERRDADMTKASGFMRVAFRPADRSDI